MHTFALVFERKTENDDREGSIAQLVQSICLTSRGSGVRTPLLPRKEKKRHVLLLRVLQHITHLPFLVV